MKYMIIGASIAAINAIEAIRRRDPHSPITVISEETDPPYSRPLISYWLAGVISDAEMLYRPRDFYQKHRVNLLVGKKAVHLNPATKTVWLDTGDALEYDTLLLACGGKNIVPPGLADVPFHTFYSWRDVREIAAKVREKGPGQHALVVGAGLVGMKAAESLRLLGVEVTVVDLADHILSSVLPQGPSKLLEALLCEDSKLHFYLGATATDVRADGGKITCRIMGMPMAFDHLVLAVGVRPNADLCKGTPIETNKGVLVDERMQTSVLHHYAAGDLAEMRGGAWGRAGRAVTAILPSAASQGQVAGANMAGADAVVKHRTVFNSLSLFSHSLVTIGDTTEDTDSVSEVGSAGQHSQFFYRDGCLCGAILLNQPERSGIYRYLVEEQIELDTSCVPRAELLALPKEAWSDLVASGSV